MQIIISTGAPCTAASSSRALTGCFTVYTPAWTWGVFADELWLAQATKTVKRERFHFWRSRFYLRIHAVCTMIYPSRSGNKRWCMIGDANVTRRYVKGKGGEQSKLDVREMIWYRWVYRITTKGKGPCSCGITINYASQVVNRHSQLFSTTYTYVCCWLLLYNNPMQPTV